MNKLFLSCLKATELIEKQLIFKLNRKEEIQLKAHKLMCSACTSYEKQSQIIEKGIENSTQAEFSIEDVESLKKEISKKLEGHK